MIILNTLAPNVGMLNKYQLSYFLELELFHT